MKKKNRIWIYPFAIMGILLILTTSCQKDENAGQVPVLTTYDISDITKTTATCGGNITIDGGLTVTARGVCWSTGQTPTISDSLTKDGVGAGSFISRITGLKDKTTYFIRAYATNSAGTGYGSAVSFTTQKVITDIDGNIYNAIRIGTQEWMVENLKVTRYRNGDSIPNITDTAKWRNQSLSAYGDYNNIPVNSIIYGKIYNFYAVADPRNLCPTGWHVPTDNDYAILIAYLGGESLAGGKLKEMGTTHWNVPNAGATNESGFTALPTGYRNINGYFAEIGRTCFYWSSTANNTGDAWYLNLNYTSSNASRRSDNKHNGFSVRCIKD